MTNLEFYVYNDDLWVIDENGNNRIVSEDEVDLIDDILSQIRECYPDAYKALCHCYQNSSKNVPYYQYLMVRRFCKCNFGSLDNTKMDVDAMSNFNFERVACPLRGECPHEGRICNPKFSTKLSSAEERVARLMFEGYSQEAISDKLYISPNTTKTHIRRIYSKLNVHDIGEFVRYATSHNMFQD